MDVLDMSAIDALRDLRDDGDDDLLAELIDLFLADAPQRMSALAAAIDSKDWEGVASWAHSLKGSCGSLGAMHASLRDNERAWWEHLYRSTRGGKYGPD